MSGYKEEFVVKREQVLKTLETVENFLREGDHLQKAENVEAQRHNLESGEFSIALVGEFSAGKSTFLNAMMGERILPSFTRETTATINFLRHKEKAEHGESGCVYYKDGRKQTIDHADLETIQRYVSTDSEDVKVAQQVDHLDLFLDSPFLKDNVTLVDTPGLNGIAEGHKDLTQRQIEQSSAGIFLFSADQPGKRTDFEILNDLTKRVKNILLVLNKVDSIKSSEGDSIERVRQSLKDNYRKECPDAKTIPEIWPVSAYNALVNRSSEDLDRKVTEEERAEAESLMRQFEERLWQFLTQGEKAKQMLMTPVTQALDTLAEIKEHNQRSMDALEGKVDIAAIEGACLELENAITDLQAKQEESQKALREDIREKEREFIDEITSQGEEYKKVIGRMVDNFTNVEEIAPENLESTIKRKLIKICDEAWINYNDGLRDVMSQHCQSTTDAVNSLLEGTELGISLDSRLTLPEYQLGLDSYDEEIKRLEKEQEELKRKEEEVADDWEKEMEIKRQRESLAARIEDERSKRDKLEQDKLFAAPPPENKQRTIMREVPRGGLVGGAMNLLFGNKVIPETENYIDRSALEDHNKKYDEMIHAHDVRVTLMEKQLHDLGPAEAEKKEKLLKRIEMERENRAKELRAFQEKAVEDYKKKNELQLKKLKNYLIDYVEELLRDFNAECKKQFKEQRKALQGVMADGIRFSVTQKIELKQKELEHQKQLSETAVNERDTDLKRYEQENARIVELSKELFDIQSELENTSVNTIKQEAL